MKKTKKALASLAIAGMVLSMAPMSVFGADTTNRISDLDRVGTAIAIANNGWAAGADSVIVVPADDANIVDALAAAPLAGQLNAPILVTYKGALDAKVQQKIVDLGAKNVYAIGALEDDVVNSLKAISGVTVEQLQGADRTETAAKVAAKLTKVNGTFVVAYEGKADALSAASFAAANSYSIVIANPDGTIPSNEAAYKVAPTYTVGGQVTVEGATVLAGADRYATNNEVLDGLEFNYDKVYVANGQSLVDALAGAPLAAQTDSPIVLADAIGVATAANDDLTSSSAVIALGGTGAVSDSVLAKVAYEAPATLEVESVSAINLKQVVVTYNQDVTDNDDAEDVDNYTFEGIAVDEDDADEIAIEDVDIDGNKVTVTFAEAVENQTEGTLTVDENVVGEDAEFTDIKFFDTTLPTVVGAEVVGNDTIKVKFSEPIDFGVLDVDGYASSDVEDAFGLNDGEFFVKSVKPMSNGTEANVEFYTEFETADYTVSVGNDLEDFAGFNVVPKDVKLTVVEDTTAPVITGYKDVTPNKITLIFDQDIEPADGAIALTEEDFFHTNSSNEAATAVIVDGNEIDLTFAEDFELPNGTAYVYVEDEAIQDLWDNVNDQRLSIAVKVEVDTTAPKVNDIEVTEQDEITLTFNEELDEPSAEKEANYTLVDADGDEVNITNAVLQDNDDGDMVEVVLSLGDKIYGDLTLTVEDVEDAAGNAMSAQTLDFNAEDETAPLFSDFTATLYSVDADIYTIVVDFDEEMSVEGKYSVLDLEKYEINGVNLADVDSDNIKITAIDDNSKVKIELEKDNEYGDAGTDLAVVATDELTVARVADAAGNYTEKLVSGTVLADVIAVDAAATVAVDKVQALDNNKIVVTLDGKVTDFEANDFIVQKLDGTDLVASGARIDNSGDDSVITITLDEDVNELSDDAKFGGSSLQVITDTVLANIGTENIYGEAVEILASNADATVKDKIVPALAEYTDVVLDLDEVDNVAFGASKVVLTFTEAINPLTVSKYSFGVEDATVASAVLSDANTVITLNVTFTGEDQEAPGLGTSVTQKNAIYDMGGNALTGIATDVQYAFDQAAADAAAADAAVTTAEGSELQADVDAAQLLVTALPVDVAPATTKADLQARLDAVQDAIDLAAQAMTSFTAVTLTQTGGVGTADVQYATAADVIAALPATITVTLADATTAIVPVTWADTDTYSNITAASYTFTGTWGTIPAGANNSGSLAAPTVEVVVAP